MDAFDHVQIFVAQAKRAATLAELNILLADVGASLVRTGVFGRSRNPIFLGMRINLAGLFLVLPNAFTFAGLLLGEALIQVQVRLEETHLSSVFGGEYEAYRRAVRRWL